MNGIEYSEAHEQWQCDYPLRGMALYEALPDQFSFDDLMHVADLLDISSLEAVEHLRIMQRELMIEVQDGTFLKSSPRVST